MDLQTSHGQCLSGAVMVHQPSPNDEVVKVVVVGDPGVGKTCLVCSWACDAHYELKNLVKTHVATVWAIDHYQRDREVMEKSWCNVDGVPVSIRLWDTFGYHDKDRGFAYRGADVVLLCFSTVCPGSLRNVKAVWLPEIRQFCPTTPIILAGTQADLRYLYNDPNYIRMEKGLMYRRIYDKDIVTPAMGRETAREVGVPFYETSVLVKFGVDDVFLNCARAALLERRRLKFWSTQLRRVQQPVAQKPMPLPVPSMPQVSVPAHVTSSNLLPLLYEQCECDVTLVAQGVRFEAHKVVLAVSSKTFKDLFSCKELTSLPSRCRHRAGRCDSVQAASLSSVSMSSDDEGSVPSDQDSDTVAPEAPRTLPCVETDTDSPMPDACASTRQYPLTVPFNHPAFAAVQVTFHTDPFQPTQSSLTTFVTLHPDITSQAFPHVLEFLYTGQVCKIAQQETAAAVRRAAELLGVNSLAKGLENQQAPEADFLNAQLEKQIHKAKLAKLRRLALSRDGFLTDVIFQVDDGQVSSHRVLLMAGCDMMHAMFSNHFREYTVDVIPFPGVNCLTFRTLMEYLYTGETTSITSADGLSLIVTANQLCLPHLLCKAEAFVVSELLRTDVPGSMEEAMLLIEPAKLHNARQLAQWCERFLSVHFQEVIQNHYKLFRTLPKELQDDIERQRWPPVWHLKELEYYDQEVHNCLQNQRHKHQQEHSRLTGCLCFSRRSRHRLGDSVDLAA